MLLLAPAVAPLVLLRRVPLVGSVMFVEPVVVSVNGFAPEVVRLPPSVIVLALATPVPPFAGVSGFCSVTLLNVGDGYVWASAIAGTSSAVRIIFFIDFLRERDDACVIPKHASGSGLGGRQRSGPRSGIENGRQLREWHRALRDLAVLHLMDRDGFVTRQRLR